MAFNPMYSPHGLGASGGLVGANPASLAYREGQIQNAIRFLQNTAVSRLTPQLRIRFLEEKGLTCAEIGEALRRTMPTAPETALVLAAAAQGKSASMAVAGLPETPGQLPQGAIDTIQNAMQPLVGAATANLDAENNAARAAGVASTSLTQPATGLPPGAVSSVYSPGMVQLGPSLYAFPQYLSSAAAAAAMLGSAATAFPHVSKRSSSWLSTLGTIAAVGLAIYGGYSLYTRWKDHQVLQQLHASIPFSEWQSGTQSAQTAGKTEGEAHVNQPHVSPSTTPVSPDTTRTDTPPTLTQVRVPSVGSTAANAPGTNQILKDLVVETKEDIFIRGFDEIKAKLRETTRDMQDQTRSIAALERLVESLTNLQTKTQGQYAQLLAALTTIQNQLTQSQTPKATSDESSGAATSANVPSSASSEASRSRSRSRSSSPSETSQRSLGFLNPFEAKGSQSTPSSPLQNPFVTVPPSQSEAPALSSQSVASQEPEADVNKTEQTPATSTVEDARSSTDVLNELLQRESERFISTAKVQIENAIQAFINSPKAPADPSTLLVATNMYLNNVRNAEGKPHANVYRRLSVHNAQVKALLAQDGLPDLLVASGFTAGPSSYEYALAPPLSSELQEALERCSPEEASEARDRATRALQQAKSEVLAYAIDTISGRT